MTAQKQGKTNTFYLNRQEILYINLDQNPSEVFIPVSFILSQYHSISSLDKNLSKVNHLKQWIAVEGKEIECLPLDVYSSIVSQMMLYEMSKETLMINLAELVHKSLMAQVITADWKRFS